MLDQACRYSMSLRLGVLVSDQACRSPMRIVGLQWGMSVSNEACLSNEACRSPMGLWWGMSVFDHACRSPMGIQSDMSFSTGSQICLRWVSDNNNIFVNSSEFNELSPRHDKAINCGLMHHTSLVITIISLANLDTANLSWKIYKYIFFYLKPEYFQNAFVEANIKKMSWHSIRAVYTRGAAVTFQGGLGIYPLLKVNMPSPLKILKAIGSPFIDFIKMKRLHRSYVFLPMWESERTFFQP